MEQKNNIDLFHLFEHRNFNALELAKTILKNNIENELLVCALNKDQILSNRAMWLLSHCADLDFERIKPFQIKLINHLKNKNLHSGVIRSVLRIFQEQPIPKKYESFMIDKCFGYINNPKEAIAVRAFAMTVVYNISKPYPELLSELSIVLTHLNIEHEGAGIMNRAKNTLKNIAKLKSKSR